MDVFGHDDIANHVEPIPATGLFEGAFEDILRVGRAEQWLPAIATERYEMQASRLLETN